jgi:hypothetical protein
MISKSSHLDDTDAANQSAYGMRPFFKCTTNEWISITARCDGIMDCFDISDELHCYEGYSGGKKLIRFT